MTVLSESTSAGTACMHVIECYHILLIFPGLCVVFFPYYFMPCREAGESLQMWKEWSNEVWGTTPLLMWKEWSNEVWGTTPLLKKEINCHK